MPALEKDEYTKAEVEDILRKNKEEVDERLEKAEAISKMSDAEKAHYDTLSGESADEFLFMEKAERENVLKNLDEEDKVLYKAADGTEIRKSHGAMALKLAKDNDRIMADNEEIRKQREDDRLTKLAETDFENLPGTVEVRKSLIKAVEGIEDETVRSAAMDSLKAKNAQMAGVFKSAGTSAAPTVVDASDAEQELEKKAKELQKQQPDLSFVDAYVKVSEMEPELYAKAVNGE